MMRQDMKPGVVFTLKPRARIHWLIFGVYRNSGVIAVRCDSDIGRKLLAWVAAGRTTLEPCTREEIRAAERTFWHDDLVNAVVVGL